MSIVYEGSITGHWKELFPKKNLMLGAHNLNDNEEIIAVMHHIKRNVECKTGRKSDPIVILNLIYFEDRHKLAPMALNVTNSIILESLYGKKHEGWMGKAVQIFAGEVNDPGGNGKVLGLKFRKFIPVMDNDDDLAEYQMKIQNTSNLAELKEVWLALPKHIQPKLKQATNLRKIELKKGEK